MTLFAHLWSKNNVIKESSKGLIIELEVPVIVFNEFEQMKLIIETRNYLLNKGFLFGYNLNEIDFFLYYIGDSSVFPAKVSLINCAYK